MHCPGGAGSTLQKSELVQGRRRRARRLGFEEPGNWEVVSLRLGQPQLRDWGRPRAPPARLGSGGLWGLSLHAVAPTGPPDSRRPLHVPYRGLPQAKDNPTEARQNKPFLWLGSEGLYRDGGRHGSSMLVCFCDSGCSGCQPLETHTGTCVQQTAGGNAGLTAPEPADASTVRLTKTQELLDVQDETLEVNQDKYFDSKCFVYFWFPKWSRKNVPQDYVLPKGLCCILRSLSLFSEFSFMHQYSLFGCCVFICWQIKACFLKGQIVSIA